ncbi:MFS transporter [Pendulispora brunnea]|uniref:MFS transporter n=1 Tax=Pendulispora brunnea TaxID=2905690 RepID=A0ABZ2KG67_9BACT
MAVIATIFVVTLAVNLQVPLYKRYADIAGYQQGLVSVTFAAYVAGLIPVLLLLGGLGDRFGNKTALLLGLTFAFAGHVAIIVDPTIQTLLKTRLLQGISIGLSVGAGTSYLAELTDNPSRAARLSTAAVTLGLGSGGLVTSACLNQQPSLAPISYYGVACATLACLGAMLLLKRRRANGSGGLVRIPLISKNTLPLGVAIFLSWSLTGIILATIPAWLALTGQGKWSGVVVFIAIAAGALIQLGPEVRHPFQFLRIGYALNASALLLLIMAIHERATALLFVASALSGLSSFGFTYVGGLTGTLAACRDDRARAVSGYYLFGYLGFGFPCIAVGYMADRWGLEGALIGYASAIAASFGLWRALRRILRTSDEGTTWIRHS